MSSPFFRSAIFLGNGFLPQAKSSKKCVGIVACAATCRRLFKLPDVVYAEHHGVGFEGNNPALDDVSDNTPQSFLAMLLQSANPNVILKGGLFVRQVSQLHGLDDAIHNHRGSKASSQS